MPSPPYPAWQFYPTTHPAPDWAGAVLDAFKAARETIDSVEQSGVTSNQVLAAVCFDLEAIGFEVEAGSTGTGKISRPVLFGEHGDGAAHAKLPTSAHRSSPPQMS